MVELGIASFVKAAGGFEITQQSDVTVDDGSLGAFTGDLMTIELTGVHLFVGVGAGDFSFDAVSGLPTALDLSGAIGFEASGVELDVALINDGASRSWTGLAAQVGSIGLVGTDAILTLEARNLSLLYNGAAGDASRLDWDQLTDDGLVSGFAGLTNTLDLQVSGYAVLSVSNFVQLIGGFEISRQSDLPDVALVGGGSKDLSVTTIGFGEVNVFVGAGPYFYDQNGDGVVDGSDTPNPNAAGLLLKDVTLALALFKPTDTADTSSYHAIYAFADDVEILGLDLGTDAFVLDASGYRLEVNGGTDGGGQNDAVNFSELPGGTFSVGVGTGSVDFDYSTILIRVAIENAVLAIGEFLYVSGGFAFSYLQNMQVTLSDSTPQIPHTTHVDAYGFGAGNVDLFVGDGPYFVDANPIDDDDGFVDGRNENAVGLALENVNFGLLMMKSTTNPSAKYIALKATADRAGLVGINILEMSARDISVEYNSVSNGAAPNDTVVVDFVASFAAGYFELDTGNGSLRFDYQDKLMSASVADAELRIDSYVFVHGDFKFEQGKRLPLVDSNGGGLLDVTPTNISASGLTMFVGVKGPYWTDLNGDGQIDEPTEVNDDAVGLAISNADLAMTLLTPAAGGIKYVGLRASSDQLAFVGTDVFNLEASAVQVELNLAAGEGANEATPVIDFAASFPSELQPLFDAIAGADSEISGADLLTTFGNDFGVTEALTTVDELVTLLNVGGAPTLADLQVMVVDPGVRAMLSGWDTDNDGKLDPTGYEIAGGAGSKYLSESNRRILATADNVYVDVADFLYVKGSIAIDVGSRQVVTVDTGIPAAFAGIISSIDPNLVNTLNGLLSGLSASLATLQGNIETAFQNAVTAVRTTVQNMVADVVANIKAQVEAVLQDPSAIDGAKGAVGGAVNSVLNGATGALSIDSIVDGAINGVVDGIPNDAALQPLKDLIRDVLSPLKTLLNNAFSQLLQQALSGTIERITGSVSEAIDAAAGKAGTAIDNAIQGVVDPQVARIGQMLDRLAARIDATITPIFTRIQSIVGINFGSGFSTIENVAVEVTSIGIGNATAFVGIPPEGGFDRGTPFAEQYTAMGLLIENFNMGLAMFKPVAGALLPTFIASKISADSVVFRIGDGDADTSNDPFTLEAKNIVVDLNLGGSIVPGAAAVLGTATIDFQASFPGDATTPVGYAVATGTTTTPIYIDFAGGLLIRAIVGNATIQISEFVYITGSFAFEMGGVATVQVADSLLPVSKLEELAGVIGLDLGFLDDIPGNIPALGADTAEMRFMTIGAADVHAFIGMKGPYWNDINENGVIDVGEVNNDAVGIVIDDFDFGMALMAPTNIFDFVRYFALKASAESLRLVGIDDVVVTADKLLVEVNSSTPGVYGIPLFPVVDFASTYRSERKALFDLLDADGSQTIEAGELNNAMEGGYSGDAITSVAQLVELLDTQGAPPSGIGANDILSLDEVLV